MSPCKRTQLLNGKVFSLVRCPLMGNSECGTMIGGRPLAEMGEVQNYASHKKLIAFTGIDPSLHESGNYIGMSKLSKRGNRHLRRVVYLMTTAVASKNPFFKAYFLRRKREGLPPQKALFATAHKLLRVIFAMLTQRTYFKPKEVI
jgi:transposase